MPHSQFRSSAAAARCEILSALLHLVLLAAPLAAQTPIGTTEFFNSQRRVIASSATHTHVAAIDPSGAVRIWSRPISGGSWTGSAPVNDTTSGIGTAPVTTEVSLTITNDGFRHLTWARASYPSFYRQYYRAMAPNGTFPGPIVELSTHAVTGGSVAAPNGRRSDSFDIVASHYGELVGTMTVRRSRVFLCAQGPGNWRNRLVEITPTIGTSIDWGAPVLRDAGLLSTSGSTQRARLAVDVNLAVHAVYYSNTVPGIVHRRCAPYTYFIYGGDPFPWSAPATLSIGSGHTDVSADISAGLNGDVHVAYNHWTSATTSSLTHRVLTAGTWSAGDTVATFSGVDADYRFAIMAATSSGRVFLARPEAGDALWLDNLTDAGTFEPLFRLRPAGSPATAGIAIQGSLWPDPDRAGCALRMVCRVPAGTPAQTCYHELDSCSFTTGEVACSYEGRLFFSGHPFAATGYDTTINLRDAHPGALRIFVAGFHRYPVLGSPYYHCNCPLLVDPVLFVMMAGTGTSETLQLVLPLTAAGIRLHTQWFEMSLNGSCGPEFGFSNLGTITVQ
ncbi:MAG: hypothetical protein KDC98_15240 [Planctomycetes bacterium]|nr:hypothetical protein [Planctomycetota bacterium]